MATAKAPQPVTGKTLREIAEERQVLDSWLLEQEGELSPDIESLLTDHEGDVTAKVEAVARYIVTEDQRAESIKAEVARLSRRMAAITNRNEWLRRYLAAQLDTLGFKPGDAVKGTLVTVRVQLNNPRLDGEEPDTDTLITWAMAGAPLAKYIRFTPEQYALDRNALLADAKLEPALLPGAMRIVRDASVRIA